MLTLINSNRMSPPIGPVGLDYVATAARQAGIETQVVDLGLADDPDRELRSAFADDRSRLVGISFRNVDDSFWPSGTWFLPALVGLVEQVRLLTDAPIVLGGVGVSIFAEAILGHTGADFAIRGDGERGIVELYQALIGQFPIRHVGGLLIRSDGAIVANPPAWPEPLIVPTSRDAIDNAAYFRRGGQAGVETKRGCSRGCIYCADPIAKGARLRTRAPSEVADEFEALATQGITSVHLCDSEFNVDPAHALAVCVELAQRNMADRVQWYAYAATTPFTAELAAAMRRAGCVGVNFGADSGSDQVLARYGQAHRRTDLAETLRHCRAHGIRTMVDLLLGGPGETPETIAETISLLKELGPDCVGAGIGMRLYPDTPAAALANEPQGVCRNYVGPIDLLLPTFYVSPELGPMPSQLVRELIAGDERFFPPAPDRNAEPTGNGLGQDHNYNDNSALRKAIENGARGAYWDILRTRVSSSSVP